MNCQTAIGHEDCGLAFITLEHEGHKSSTNSWERSSNKVYYRKIRRQQGKDIVSGVKGFKR